MSAPEEKLLFKPNSSGAVSVCLAYPGTREVALANLGFQAVFRILATTPGVVCERAYQPEPGHALLSYESRRAAGDFDILAFSLSFESDYPLVVSML
ncbi:MAG: radical SAM protein, partial [Deltaproteobacteria bacterium]|nr:radical SAM protein [Deltaproteobacteria bacterium]